MFDQVCKEEEEAIKVDVHEGCGRVKLFWLLALSDARNLKSLVEFRHNASSSAGAISSGTAGGASSQALHPCASSASNSVPCRYCGSPVPPSLFDGPSVCTEPDCQVSFLLL